MITVKISKWGNSMGIRLNSAVLDVLEVVANDSLDIFVDTDKHEATLRKHTHVPQTLDELLGDWEGDFETHSVMEEVEVGDEIV